MHLTFLCGEICFSLQKHPWLLEGKPNIQQYQNPTRSPTQFEKKKEKKKEQGDSLGSPLVKNPPANAGDTGSIPGLERSHKPQSN